MLSRKVDNSTFVWAIGLLSGVMLAVAGWCFTEVTAVRQQAAANEAAIRTYIDTGNAGAQSLSLTIGRIQTDVDWIKRQLEQQQQQSRSR